MKPARPPRNLKILVEYDGTQYAGWQIQQNRKTVQGELTRAIREITGEKVTLFGAGRTDAGVHAEGQVANFRTKSRLPAEKWPNAINAHLPEDICVLSAEDVPAEFHSQFRARGKIYRYLVLQRSVRSALYRGASHLMRAPLAVEPMQEAARLLLGRHDFRSFGTDIARKRDTVRTLTRAGVERRGDFIAFTFEGDGFLYNMVRSMVGTLLEVGLGNRPSSWIGQVLEAKDRRQAGANVPAKGLCLVRVLYDPASPGGDGK